MARATFETQINLHAQDHTPAVEVRAYERTDHRSFVTLSLDQNVTIYLADLASAEALASTILALCQDRRENAVAAVVGA